MLSVVGNKLRTNRYQINALASRSPRAFVVLRAPNFLEQFVRQAGLTNTESNERFRANLNRRAVELRYLEDILARTNAECATTGMVLLGIPQNLHGIMPRVMARIPSVMPIVDGSDVQRFTSKHGGQCVVDSTSWGGLYI